jgi:hypothetical protein
MIFAAQKLWPSWVRMPAGPNRASRQLFQIARAVGVLRRGSWRRRPRRKIEVEEFRHIYLGAVAFGQSGQMETCFN